MSRGREGGHGRDGRRGRFLDQQGGKIGPGIGRNGGQRLRRGYRRRMARA
jgi:hypothetical protein